MRCSKARHDIELMLDGELRQSHVRALELHLEACPRCREFQAREFKLLQILKSQPQPEFPAWLHYQVLDQVARHDKQRLSYKHRLKLQTVPALLAIVLSLTFGALIGKFSYGKVNPLPDSTQTAAPELEDNQQLARFGESSILDYSFISGGSNE